jgi:integrase
MTRLTMVSLAEEYLAYRRNLGAQLRIEGQELLRFARWADQSGHSGPITTELALRWAALPQDRTQLYRARRLEVVRCFARYRAIFDPRTEIPPDRLLGPAHCRTAPYIYSARQIAEMLTAANALAPPNGLRPQTYRMLLGLLACTGLRISEALKLTRDDVDLQQGLLTIGRSKFHKSRLVPLHPSTAAVLRQYAGFRDHYHPLMQSKAFFLSESGKPLAYSTVRITFRRICRRLGWKPGPTGREPRIHDLRHTFVCRRVLAWYEAGADVEHSIAALSTYLGHRKVTDTYWYLTGIPELMAVAAQHFERFARSGGAQ